MKYREGIFVIALMALSGALTGCDPEDVSAAGTVRLAEHIDVENYQRLCIVTIEEEDFDPNEVYGPDTLRSSDFKADLSEVVFPYDYATDGYMGASYAERFKVLAWLTSSEDLYCHEMVPGDAYGTTSFRSKDCSGFFHGERCGQTKGVDILIDHIKPEDN